MTMSSNGNIFSVTDPLYGEITGHWWIPQTKASDAELWRFSMIYAWINGWVKQSLGWWFELELELEKKFIRQNTVLHIVQ